MSSSSFIPGPILSRQLVRACALEAGFAEAGLVALPYADEARDAARFEDWAQAGRAATMHYLTRAGEDGRLVRARVAIPFPWARSAIVCFANYHSLQPLSTEPAAADNGWMARYAWSSRTDVNGTRRPSDYHKVLLKRIKLVEARLHQQFGAFESRAYVDTGPVVERALATAAGLGWTGKNTCLIHPTLGSYGFLAVLLTSIEAQEQPVAGEIDPSLSSHKSRVPQVSILRPGIPQPSTDRVGENQNTPQAGSGMHPFTLPDRCGTCRRCLDACPTDALFAPYQMDASRCISYLTIEHRGVISAELMEGMGRQVFGCDICQDVCPWNRKAPISPDPDLAPRAELVNPALDWLAAMDEAEFERHFNGSPVRRAGFLGLRRNVAVAMGNSGLAQFAAKLEEWAENADEGLCAAARWGLEKLRGARAGNNE